MRHVTALLLGDKQRGTYTRKTYYATDKFQNDQALDVKYLALHYQSFPYSLFWHYKKEFQVNVEVLQFAIYEHLQ